MRILSRKSCKHPSVRIVSLFVIVAFWHGCNVLAFVASPPTTSAHFLHKLELSYNCALRRKLQSNFSYTLNSDQRIQADGAAVLYSLTFPSPDPSLPYQNWHGYLSWLVLRSRWIWMPEKSCGLTLPLIFPCQSCCCQPPWDAPTLAISSLIWGALSILAMDSSTTIFTKCLAPWTCGCFTSWVGHEQLFLVDRK